MLTSGKPQTIGELLNHGGTVLYNDITDWCRGRSPLARIPLLLFFGYIGVRQLIDPMYQSLFGGINLGIHEGGHLLFRALGEFICVAGGTILQLFAPLASMIMFFKQRDYFAIAVCFGWLSTNFMGVGIYMSDAEKMRLPLVTVGNHNGGLVTHDWRYLFTKLGLLSSCETIGFLTIVFGHFMMLMCLVFGFWLLWQMHTLPPPKKSSIF